MATARRIGRIAAWSLAGLVGLVVVLVAAGLIVLNTGAGGAWAARTVSGLARTPDSAVRIGSLRLRGLDLDAADIALADRDGDWLRIGHVTFDWRPLALLTRRLDVTRLVVGDVAVLRKPLPGPPKTEEKPAGFSVPHIPVAVRVGQLQVAPVRIGAPVLGEAMTLRVDGVLGVHGDQAILTRATIQRTDAPSRVALAATFRPGRPSLDIALAVDEPAGGLIGRLAKLPGTPPVSIRLDGAGPLDDWHGRLKADLPGLVQADGTLGGDLHGPGRITGALAAAFGPLMPEPARQALGDRVDIALAATLGADQSIAIDSLALAAPNLRADLKGRIAPADKRIDGLDLTLDVPDGTKLRPLLGKAAFATARLAVHAAGRFDAPEVNVALDAGDVAVEGVGRLPRVTLRGKAVAPAGPDAPDAVPVTLALRLDNPVLDQAALGNLLGTAPTLELTAEWARDDKIVRIGALTLKGRAIDLGATGTYAVPDKAIDAKLNLAVAPLKVAAPGADGSARATIAIKGALTGALVADVRAEAERLAYPAVPALAVLGRDPKLSGHFERRADGTMRLDDLKLDGAQVALTAQDCRIADEVSCAVRGRLDSLSPLAPKGGTRLAGRAEFALDARGPRTNPVVTLRAKVLDGQVGTTAFKTLTADARVENPAGDAKGRVGLDLDAPAGNARLGADFALTEQKSTLRVANLGLVGPGITAKGTLAVKLKDKLAQGTLDLRVDDAGKLAALAGMTAQGQADAHVALSTPGGKQAADLTLRAAKLRVETAPGNVTRLASADLRAQATDLLGAAGRLSAELRAGGLGTPTARLQTLTVNAQGPMTALAVRAAVDGQIIQPTGARPLSLTLDGQVARGAGGATTVRLDHLGGKALDIPVALRKPARITLARGATTIEGLALGLADGTVTADATVSQQAIQANLGLRKLPASLASAARPDLHLTGTLDGSASLTARPGGGQGQFTLRFQGLRVLSTGDEKDALSGTPTLAGSAEGRWDGRQAQVSARVAGLSGTDATIRAALPLAAPPDSAAPALVKTAPLSAHVDWKGPIAPLWTLVPMEEHRLSGDASIVVDVAGTAATPQVAADIRLTNGRYEHLVWGTELRRMTLNARADASGNLDATLGATDGAKGTLTARARIGLNQPGQPVDAVIDLKSFLVARRDDATVMTDAHITASGPAKSARIEGQVTTDKVEIALTASLPPSVVTLDVDQVNGPPRNGAPRLKPQPGTIRIRGPLGPPAKAAPAQPARAAAADQADAAAAPKPAPAAAMPLMLRIRMPNGVFVRGRGLESEWKGNLRIEGTSAAPRIFGTLQIVRGDLTLAGKTLGLDDSSTITFPGTTSVDPLLDLTANLEQSDLTAALHVTGRASQPKIELSSTPALPQDEILAHMLFDKSSSELSPFEAVQLASAAAELSGALGSGPGMMGKLRSGLGLDVLRFQNNSEGQATLGAGKYVSKRVYIGVQQGLDASSSQVTVNIDITKHLSVETDVGAASNSRAGVNWKYDY